MKPTIHIVGGGLAGSEAAWQCLQNNCKVVMYEMRPLQQTPAHKTGGLAELVCSNSLKSKNPASAPGLLKQELRSLDSLILTSADQAEVPAGQALAVDREVLSHHVEQALTAHSDFTRVSKEIHSLPSIEEMENKNEAWIVATGPLTAEPLADFLRNLCGQESLAFYDAIAPILSTESINMDIAFRSDRYGTAGEGDYINLPLNKEEYESFIQDVKDAEKMPLHKFESTGYFECCLPIEVMVERGDETLRFGPMKPVGLTDPRTGHRPWACLQLRQENKHGTMHSMVGFQTKMKWPEQRKVFSKLPGLEQAEFLRFGSVHRNTYVEGPEVMNADLSLKNHPRIFLAGQITGVEGYTESTCIGLLAGRLAAAKLHKTTFSIPPEDSVTGSLLRYVTVPQPGKFAPMNANFGLLPPIDKRKKEGKSDRKARHADRIHKSFEAWYKNSMES
ncbi:MAG: methylenetetrahydrofolate--tRNA-(uracil(54)-C(5))-methyltransferase (FADH(2)-oxidizing) TrmFO [Oligoflexales bacterium]